MIKHDYPFSPQTSPQKTDPGPILGPAPAGPGGNVAVIFLGGCMVGLQNFSWTKLTVLAVAPGQPGRNPNPGDHGGPMGGPWGNQGGPGTDEITAVFRDFRSNTV